MFTFNLFEAAGQRTAYWGCCKTSKGKQQPHMWSFGNGLGLRIRWHSRIVSGIVRRIFAVLSAQILLHAFHREERFELLAFQGLFDVFQRLTKKILKN